MELPRSRQAEPDLERVRRNSSIISFPYSVICTLKVKTISVPRTGLIGIKAPAGTIVRVNRFQNFLVARPSVDLDAQFSEVALDLTSSAPNSRANLGRAGDGARKRRIAIHQIDHRSRDVIVDFGCRADVHRIAHQEFHPIVRKLELRLRPR